MKPVSGKGDCVSGVSYSSVLGAVAVNLANQHILVECVCVCGGGCWKQLEPPHFTQPLKIM